MSTKKSVHKDKSKKWRLTEKSMSFNGQSAEEMVGKLPRPRTLPELKSGRFSSSTEVLLPKLTKLLLNVTIQRSLGPFQVLISPESTVKDLIAESLRLYSKEGRRPILPSLDPSRYGLHYSQFSLESLDPDEKLIKLGSRNFFLCPKQTATDSDEVGRVGRSNSSAMTTCSEEAENVTKTGPGWLRFMNLLQ
ncbi:uncharacterized protein At4g22758-like [Bidens hawaiensis]|uniref:uncharacterized protein At4g22758-like n=1 Tax=Bidens hawaiensis TaxID=980011 RepID=UPI00404A9816